MSGGTLFVVATPLGHLGDLTGRATGLLRSVPVVAAEDTRRTRALLAHLDAHPRLVSYHAHSRRTATSTILSALGRGDDVALVTDAGTPGVSDPGSALVEAARSAGHRIVPIPGPSAVTAALSAGGLPADRFVFLGFIPRKGAARDRLLARTGQEEWTTVLFEAPGRVGELLADLVRVCGADRRAVVARELTKLHEEFRTGTLGELAAEFGASATILGECTIIVEGATHQKVPMASGAERAAGRLLAAGVPRREVIEMMEELFGISRNEAYRMTVRSKE